MTLASDPKPFSFLRLPAAARRRRARPWLALARRTGVVVMVVLPVAGLVAWLLFSQRFAVQHIEVRGAERVARSWLEQRLGMAHGSNVLRLDLGALHGEILEHQWVRSASLSKRLPGRLEIVLEEHLPAARLRDGERTAVVSYHGEIIESPDVPPEAENLEIRLHRSLGAG